jgi:hypothetical protein
MEGESMPVVNAADLKAVHDFFLPDRLRCGGGGAFTVTPGSVEAICSPGANLEALSHRETFLHVLLKTLPPEIFAPWINDGQPDMKLFQVMASFPLPVPDYAETQPHDFDLEGFIQQLTRKDGAPGET